MKRKLLTWACLLALPCAHAAPVTIDFDGPVQADISTAYAGVTFRSATGVGLVGTVATPGADTPGNVIALGGDSLLSQTDSRAIDIVFDTAVSAVSIRGKFVVGVELYTAFGTALPFMSAFNSDVISAATRIGTDTWDIAGDACLTSTTMCVSGWDTLQLLSSSADIKAIRISGFGYASTPRRAMFDTLTWEAAGGGGGGGTVPEPSSLALAGLAGLGLLASRRRKAAPGPSAAAA